MDDRSSPRILRRIGLFAGLWLLCLTVGLIGCGGGGGSTSVSVAAPTITAQPTSLTTVVGDSASFGVTASGTGLSYQWYKGGVAITEATSASYSITSAATTDAGSYYVIVTNSAGHVTSSSVTLTVSASTGSGTVTVQ